LEKKIAKFHGREDAILYPSCFDANAGLFEQILTPEDAVISDELNHASIIDGIRLCKAQKWRYTHRNMADLEAKLIEAQNKEARRRLIVTDGVFSMVNSNFIQFLHSLNVPDYFFKPFLIYSRMGTWPHFWKFANWGKSITRWYS